MTSLKPPPLAVYVHFPWCARKCPYCDFNSHEIAGELPEADYVDALARDLDSELAQLSQNRICSIFLGGGTPSLFSPDAIARVVALIDDAIPLAPDAEVTMEANPGTTEQARFHGYRDAGVNRLSIGVQSFRDAQLGELGRIHSAGEAIRAFHEARAAGFDNINLDLMHGLPGQSVELALEDLRAAIDLDPEHISWYQLTLEPNTRFYKFPPPLPDEETMWQIFERGTEILGHAGYRQYEISAWSRAGRRSVHNLNYWQFGDYIGIGAGAHGKLTTSGGIVRTTRTRAPRDYLADPGRKVHRVPAKALPLEYLMNVLRTPEGFDADDFEARTGLRFHELDEFLERAVSRELLTIDERRVRPTDTGLRYLNDLLMPLVD